MTVALSNPCGLFVLLCHDRLWGYAAGREQDTARAKRTILGCGEGLRLPYFVEPGFFRVNRRDCENTRPAGEIAGRICGSGGREYCRTWATWEPLD